MNQITKVCIMDNNVKFISSIKKETDFEELVRRFVQKIFGVEAHLVGGPYDGGRDIAYSRRGKEIKEASQISIQEKNIESKIEDDLVKVAKLVDNHGYPSTLYFFWSHTLSASMEDKIKTNARTKYGITLEVYDANKIAQKITNDYPELLQYLLETIHQYKPSSYSDTNIQERAFYDYLVLSKDTTNLKKVIIESRIVAQLYEKITPQQDLVEYMKQLGLNEGQANGKISDLTRSGRIQVEDGQITLSENETTRIKNIEIRENSRRDEVLSLIQDIIKNYTTADISEEVLELIKETYAASVNIQISDLNFEPPKISLVKESANKISLLLKKHGLNHQESTTVAHQLITSAAENEYLSAYCSSRLCIGLLDQKKLERYIEDKYFFIYLDAPVLIRFLVLLRFLTDELLDSPLTSVKRLMESFRHLHRKKIRATNEHFEETIRHLENAEKISRFANDELISKFGDSKNIFFNMYLKQKELKGERYNFPQFLEELIGFEDMPLKGADKFNALLDCAQKLLALSNVEVIHSNYDLDTTYVNKMVQKYWRQTGKSRKPQTAKNDLVACQILGDSDKHCDDKGVEQPPILITWDATQHDWRDIYRQEHRHQEWLIYTPQRAVERLSMIGLKVNSAELKDSVLAIIDEDFFNDAKHSLIDTLSIFLGEDLVETGAVISLLTKLTNRITKESHDPQHVELESINVLNDVLMYTQREFRADFDKVRQLFADVKFEQAILSLLQDTVKNEFGEDGKEKYKNQLLTILSQISE